MWAGIAAARVGERRIARARREATALDTFLAGARRTSWTTASRSRGARSRSCRRGRSRSRRSRTAAPSTRSRSRSPTTSSSSTCATTPTRTTGRTTPRATASLVAAQMVFMNLTDAARVGERRPLPAADGCSPARARSSTPSPPAAFAIYYEVEIRLYDLIWRCLAPHLGDRLPAGQLRLDLRHVHRRAAPGHRAALHDRRAAGRRLGRLGRRATATARSSAASTATRSTARPRSPRRATGSTSTGSRSTTRRAARASTAAARASSLDYRVRSNGCFFTCAYTRNKHRPWPLDGGREGSPNYAEVIRADGTRRGVRRRHGARASTRAT